MTDPFRVGVKEGFEVYEERFPVRQCDFTTSPGDFRKALEIPLSQYHSFTLNPTPHIAHLGHADPVVWHISFWHVL
jgi:hypothetical protein